MKVKLIASPENYDAVADELKKLGIEINEKANFILTERNITLSYLIGKKDEEIYRLKTSEISHIESFGHEVIAYTNDGAFKVNERLKTLAELLDSETFIRISNSVIISVDL